METSHVLQALQHLLWLTALLSAPPLGAALVSGILSGTLQAATQIQDAAISNVTKLLATGLALAFFAPWIVHHLSALAFESLEGLRHVGR